MADLRYALRILALLGLGLGLVGALAASRLLASLACFVPARRAATLDPLVALRNPDGVTAG